MNLKERILAKVSQMDIYRKYIGPDIQLKRDIKSPLRNERRASFGLYQHNGNILFKDFGGEQGDCFKFVMLKFDVGFAEACKIIAEDFNVPFTGPIPKRRILPVLTIPKIQHAEFEYKEKAMDSDYWNQYGITREILTEYNVVEIQWVKGSTWKDKVETLPDNPIFCYKYPSGRVRFYRPKSKSLKHFGNVCRDDVFGLEQLDKGPIVICAGQKDVLTLYAHSGIRGVSLNSEASTLAVETYLKLKEVSNEIWVCYDNDETGYKYMDLLNKTYNIKKIILKDLYPDLPVKEDISWYFKNGGKLNNLLNVIYDYSM